MTMTPFTGGIQVAHWHHTQGTTPRWHHSPGANEDWAMDFYPSVLYAHPGPIK